MISYVYQKYPGNFAFELFIYLYIYLDIYPYS